MAPKVLSMSEEKNWHESFESAKFMFQLEVWDKNLTHWLKQKLMNHHVLENASDQKKFAQ